MFEFFFTHPLWAYRAGNFALASSWPRWLLLTCALAAYLLIAASLWRRRFLGLSKLLLIGTLQAALAISVLCLLWRPVLNVERVRDRQNVLAIVLDNSQSMYQSMHQSMNQSVSPNDSQNGTSQTPSRLQAAIATLRAGPLAELSKTFELRFFAFGKELTPLTAIDALPKADTQTRIGSALLNVLQTAGSVPLAGVLLVSDGAATDGSLNEANLSSIVSYGVPIHTLGVGPERIDNDLELESVEVPATIASGSTVTANFSVRHSGAATTRLRVYDRDTLLAARELKLLAKGEAKHGYITTDRIEFPAGDTGVHDLRFVLDPLPNERNVTNNTRRLVLNVPAARRSILYVEGEPRWEFKFIRRALEDEHSLRLVTLVRTTQNKYYRQGINSSDELADGFPSTAEELFAYDAIVIGSYEAITLNAAQQELLKQFVDRRGGGLLLLAARSGLGDGGWGNSIVSEVLPTHLPKKHIDFTLVENKAQLTEYGAESALLRFDADAKINLAQWQSLPLLSDYQALGNLKPGAMVLLETTINHNREPLLVSQRFGRGVVYELATASTQRWQTGLPLGDRRHEIFWRQLLHALADQAPQRATVATNKVAYDDERSVTVEAQLRDRKFELLPTGDKDADAKMPSKTPGKTPGKTQVELTVTPEQGESYVQTMQPSATQEGHYTATLNAETAGVYKLELVARTDKDEILTANNAFRRDDNVVESLDAFQHRDILERLAKETSGRYWRMDELQNLSKAIVYTKSGIVERQTLSLWNLPIVFLILLLLKLSEWLLRLRWGTL